MLCSASGDRLNIWDADGLAPMRDDEKAVPSFPVRNMTFAPDGKRIYLCLGKGLFYCNTGDLSFKAIEPGNIYHCLFLSADGKHLLAGDDNGGISLWDTHTLRCLDPFPDHEKAVKSISAASDLSVVVTGGDDHAVHVMTGIFDFKRAPWELCEAKSYEQEASLREEIAQNEADIKKAAADGNIARAVKGEGVGTIVE